MTDREYSLLAIARRCEGPNQAQASCSLSGTRRRERALGFAQVTEYKHPLQKIGAQINIDDWSRKEEGVGPATAAVGGQEIYVIGSKR